MLVSQVKRRYKSKKCKVWLHLRGRSAMKSRIIFWHLLAIVSGFEIYWNVPTGQCYKMSFAPLLRTYGIQVNDGDKFQGNRVTIFYESQLGLYPRILKNGKMENGGIPQVKCKKSISVFSRNDVEFFSTDYLIAHFEIIETQYIFHIFYEL